MPGPEDSRGPRILVVGYNAFDIIVPVRGFPAPDQKCEVPGIMTGGGGPGATAAVALCRLGARVRLLTPLTDDPYGQLQRRELLDAGVDLSLSPTLRGHQSPQAVIMVDELRAHRTIFWSRGDVPRLSACDFPPEILAEVDLLYTDGHEAEVSIHLAKAASARGLPVVMDAGSVREGSAELVTHCTDVVGSRIFAPDLTGQSSVMESLEALRLLGPARVGMTFGKDGSLGLDHGGVVAVPAFKVPVTDTTGAGDAFHAGYAFARAAGESLKTCLEWGSAVAGLKCRDWGGRCGLPDLQETTSLLDQGPTRSLEGLREHLPPTAG